MGEILGLNKLFLKDEGRNPTHSLEDRSVGVSTSKIVEFRSSYAACASIGNIADSFVAHCAKGGLGSFVFVPEDTPMYKVIPWRLYGAEVIKVKKSPRELECHCHANDPASCMLVTRLVDDADLQIPVVDLNMRPYFGEGYKTLGFEICEQLRWKAPTHIILPEGTGTLSYYLYRGIELFAELGIIDDDIPAISIIQPEGCAPISNALVRGGKTTIPVRNPNTICSSLRVGDPPDGVYALEVVRKTKGYGSCISDENAKKYVKILASAEGIFTDVAGGIALGGLADLVNMGKIDKSDEVVVVLPAAGYKTREVMKTEIEKIPVVTSSIESFKSYLIENR
jgi:threonine synthase